jgi:hypothetical protein
MIATATRHQRHGALMRCGCAVIMDPRVQLRRRGASEREKKRGDERPDEKRATQLELTRRRTADHACRLLARECIGKEIRSRA